MARIDQNKIDDLPPSKPRGKREDYPKHAAFCVRKSFNTASGQRFKAGAVVPEEALTKPEITALKRMKAIEREK